ncbi:hypothetical protein DRH14_04805, partial [Candidatus Shapirobacteria bacterium]
MLVNKKLKALFSSRTRLALIKIFFGKAGEMFYVRQLTRLSGEEINSVRRELAKLLKISVLLSEKRGNRLYYWVNFGSVFYRPLLIMAQKSSGLGMKIISKKRQLGKLKYLIYSSHFANGLKNRDGLVDLIVVGRVDLD